MHEKVCLAYLMNAESLTHVLLNREISSWENDADPDQLADQDLHCFPFSLWIKYNETGEKLDCIQ